MWINLGCGRVILPGLRPDYETMLDAEVYEQPLWLNVDRNAGDGVDQVVDLFSYPWPWPDNSFGGALASHIVEHIPHEARIIRPDSEHSRRIGGYWQEHVGDWLKRVGELETLQDGWFVWFSELHRVLEPGAVVHIIVPHGHSDGALADPTHTRYVMPHTFGYFNNDSLTFAYNIGSRWEIAGDISYQITEPFLMHLNNTGMLQMAMMTQINVVYQFYVRLRAVKP